MKLKSKQGRRPKKPPNAFGWSARTGTYILRPARKKGATITVAQVQSAMRRLGLNNAK